MRDDIAMQMVNIDMTVTKLRCIYLLSQGFFCQTTSGNNKRKKYLTQKNSKFGMKLKRDIMIFIEHDVSVLRHFSQD